LREAKNAKTGAKFSVLGYHTTGKISNGTVITDNRLDMSGTSGSDWPHKSVCTLINHWLKLRQCILCTVTNKTRSLQHSIHYTRV